MDGMDDLVQFLRDRYDDEESAARGAKGDTSGRWTQDDGPPEDIVLYDKSGKLTMGQARHIARHDPARVLAAVDAKRRRLARHAPERRRLALNDESGTTSFAFLVCTSCTPNRVIDTSQQTVVEWPCPDLRDDAAVYADHPDYRDKWRPTT